MAESSEPRIKPIKRAEQSVGGIAPALGGAMSVAPITIGPRNAVEMTGLSWRWLRDNAERLGVSVLRVGGKSMIPAAPLLEALAREGAAKEPRELTDEEERENLRRQLGMRRVPQRSAAG